MCETKQKRPAHEVIVEKLEEALKQLDNAERGVSRGASREDMNAVARASGRCDALIEVLEEMDVPDEDVRRWVSQKLTEIAGRVRDDLSRDEIRKILPMFRRP